MRRLLDLLRGGAHWPASARTGRHRRQDMDRVRTAHDEAVAAVQSRERERVATREMVERLRAHWTRALQMQLDAAHDLALIEDAQHHRGPLEFLPRDRFTRARAIGERDR